MPIVYGRGKLSEWEQLPSMLHKVHGEGPVLLLLKYAVIAEIRSRFWAVDTLGPNQDSNQPRQIVPFVLFK